MSTKTKNYEFYKPELSDPADITKLNENWDKLDEEIAQAGTKITSVTSNDGITFTGELLGVDALYPGLKITIIPNRESSTKDVKLNINSLGDVYVIMPIVGTPSGSSENGADGANWLSSNKPVPIMYDGTFWRTDIQTIPTLPTVNGGTGLKQVTRGNYLVGNGTDPMVEKTPGEVLQDIGGAPMYTFGTTDMQDGVTPLETNKLYFYYEG